MKYFDLHCDTIEELKKRGENFLNSTTQFTIQDHGLRRLSSVWPSGYRIPFGEERQ
jgi:hypothetical protein